LIPLILFFHLEKIFVEFHLFNTMFLLLHLNKMRVFLILQILFFILMFLLLKFIFKFSLILKVK